MISPTKSLLEQKRLLTLEYEADKESFRRLSDSYGLKKIIDRGNAWYPVRFGRTYYNSLNQRVIEIFRNEREDTEHNFEYGRPVALFTSDEYAGNLFSYHATGTVSFVDGDRMVMTIPENADLSPLLSAGKAGVQLSFDETTYKLMFDAISRTLSATGRLAYLRDLFYSRRKAETLSFGALRFPYLNRSQEEAVNLVTRAKDVAVVHGPPGTGKTTTLVEAIYETLRRESQVMVCAQSNMAVDWISEKLVDRGINVLRLGNPSKVNDKMLSFSYERKFESHPDYPELWSIRKLIRELRSGSKRNDEKRHQKIERLKSRATEIEIRINAELFDDAKVIASTLAGSANRLLDGKKFPTLFIDEAAQALEPACWIAIRRAGRVVLAGDHCQLPPTVKCFDALKGGLGKTLMERIVENHPEAVSLLDIQYRMHEDIMRFSSEWFYNGSVKAAPEVRYRGILDFDSPMEWIDTSSLAEAADNDGGDYIEETTGSNFGRINRKEAELTVAVLEDYFNKIGRQRILEENIDVGIISPYRAQTHYLRSLIARKSFFKPFRKNISVNTVDGFQGQERDIILISLVRSNEEKEIGFLKDLRRMNVAITRARMKLIILGNASTLSRYPFYRKLHESILRCASSQPEIFSQQTMKEESAQDISPQESRH